MAFHTTLLMCHSNGLGGKCGQHQDYPNISTCLSRPRLEWFITVQPDCRNVPANVLQLQAPCEEVRLVAFLNWFTRKYAAGMARWVRAKTR